MTNIKEQIRKICTYHDKEGTSGWLLDEDRFTKIFALIDKQRKEILGEVVKRMIPVECELPEEGKPSRVKFYHLSEEELTKLKLSKDL